MTIRPSLVKHHCEETLRVVCGTSMPCSTFQCYDHSY